jgi:hypothetical protein
MLPVVEEVWWEMGGWGLKEGEGGYLAKMERGPYDSVPVWRIVHFF